MPVFGFSCKLMVRKIADCKSACVPLHTGWWEDSFLFFFTSNPVGFLWVCTLQFTKTSRSTKTQILGRCSARVWHRSWKAATSRSCALWNGQVGRTDGWQAVIELNHGRANHYILARSKNFKTLELHRQIMAINEVSNKYLPKIWQI